MGISTSTSENASPLQIAGGLFLILLTITILVSVAQRNRDTQQPVSIETAAAYQISFGRFLTLRDGMSYRDAVKVLGKEGTEISRNTLAGNITVMYQWQNDNYSTMNAMFQNDRLVSKAQFGLK